MAQEYMTYKSRPVVRSGNTIYYGSMANEYVVMMNVMKSETAHDVPTATAIKCYLMKTDKSLNPMQAITQTSERSSLYDALELAAAWLNRQKS